MNPIKSSGLKVTSYYGNRTYTYKGEKVSDFHHGIDLVSSPAIKDAEIVAFEDGIVTAIQRTGAQYSIGCYVRLKHVNGLYTLYYHLKSGSVCVNVGQSVKKGDKLGIIGATGKATGVHLHFQIDKGSSSTSINPYDYIFNNVGLIDGTIIPNKVTKTNEEIAKEVIQGKWGNGNERKTRLIKAGYNYSVIQGIVNKMLSNKNTTTKTNEELAREVIQGKWGNGTERKERLTKAGYNYYDIQAIVNKMLK